MRHLYSLLMYLLTPCLLLRLWWKGRRLPAYRERIAERFCWGKMTPAPIDVWVHAVSLGEVIAAIPLIDALLSKHYKILITTMTPTGAMRVKARFGEKVRHRYIPYDLPSVLRRFFSVYQPRAGVIIETELWPNLINQATRFEVPLLLINARLSERSYRSYKKGKFFFEPLLNQFHAILAQSADDAKRFKLLGAADEKVAVFGNMKFDLQIQNIDSAVFTQLKNRWGKQRAVIMAASTHEDEELQLLSRLKILQASIPDVILLIAPRHPERFQKIFQLSEQSGFKTGLRSRIDSLQPDLDVVVLDSLGELLGFYQLSDYAFVGGSLVPVGGHNVLEPIAMHVPVLTGRYMFNSTAIIEDLRMSDAIELVDNADDLVAKIIMLHQDTKRKSRLVDNAMKVLTANKGAVERYIAKLESCLVMK
ncbi:MAG: lipid IV(A) 3-deoxy-D-manno-octulosonic acid transferase [Legionella sp.]|nr:lipid IV(A) 3-deoxy-D-manno-octulosonic acid transferase [Legionella sp.]